MQFYTASLLFLGLNQFIGNQTLINASTHSNSLSPYSQKKLATSFGKYFCNEHGVLGTSESLKNKMLYRLNPSLVPTQNLWMRFSKYINGSNRALAILTLSTAVFAVTTFALSVKSLRQSGKLDAMGSGLFGYRKSNSSFMPECADLDTRDHVGNMHQQYHQQDSHQQPQVTAAYVMPMHNQSLGPIGPRAS